MRKWRIRGAFAGVVLAACTLLLVSRSEDPPLAVKRFDQLKEGMTLAQVEGILGKKGDRRSGPTTEKRSMYSDRPWRMWAPPDPSTGQALSKEWWDECTLAQWQSDTVTIAVAFRPEGNAAFAYYRTATKDEVSFRDRLVWLAKREWQKWFP